MSDTNGSRTTRGEALYAAHQEKVREAFEGKHFTVLKEVHLDEDQRFETAFGNKGRHGVILQEDGNPDNKIIVGATILRRIASEYGAVDLPPETQKRKRRTKAQKQADDEAAAQLKTEARVAQAKLIDEILSRSQDERQPVVATEAEEVATEESPVVSGLFANK